MTFENRKNVFPYQEWMKSESVEKKKKKALVRTILKFVVFE